MNGIDKIKQRITQEVQGEIAALEAQAKAADAAAGLPASKMA